MVSNLPEQSYVLKPGTEEVVLVKRGEPGFYPTNMRGDEGFVRKLNDKLGVSPAQTEAMMVGSLFGWDVPGADPAKYEGNLDV